MKIYTLVHLQDNNITDADATPFLSREEAQAAMKTAWEDALKAAGIDPAEQQCDEREWECGEDAASIRVDFDSIYETWKITEHRLPVDIAVMVKGGLVQQIISNAGVNAEVFDLDVSDFPDEGEEDEVYDKEAEYEKLLKTPGWAEIW